MLSRIWIWSGCPKSSNVNNGFPPETGLPYADAETGAAVAVPQGLTPNADGGSVLQGLSRLGFNLSESSIEGLPGRTRQAIDFAERVAVPP